MSNTVNQWTQDSPQTDGQLFIGASEFVPLVAASAAFASAGAGLFSQNIPASTTANLFANVNLIVRTGTYAKGPLSGGGSSAFGTSGPPPVPGPSTVAGTSGPRSIVSAPPILKANLPTIKGTAVEPVPKGIEVLWIDVIYTVSAVNLTSATLGLTTTTFKDSVAPVVANIVALGQNGLSLAFQITPHRIRVTPETVSFITLDGTEIVLNLNFVTPAGSSVIFYGVVLGIGYNYN